MKATIDNNLLLKELKKLSPIIRKNVVIPISASVLFEFDKNKLTLTGTDLETIYITSFDCKCDVDFSVPIKYSDIVEIVSSVSAPIVLINEGDTVNISSGKSKYKLSTPDKKEHFPPIPEEDFYHSLEVDGEFFYALSNANDFRLDEDLKVNMNMPCIDILKNKIVLIGTNNHYLYKYEIKNKSAKELSVMVCNNFVSLCSSFQNATISFGDKFIKVEVEGNTIISRLSENKFVNYSVVVPEEITYNVKIDKSEIKSAIKSILVSTNPTERVCLFEFSKGKIKLTASDIDTGKEAETEIDIDHKVTFDKICLNAGMIMTMLNHIDAEELELSFRDERKCAVIRPLGDKNILSLIFPLVDPNIKNN